MADLHEGVTSDMRSAQSVKIWARRVPKEGRLGPRPGGQKPSWGAGVSRHSVWGALAPRRQGLGLYPGGHEESLRIGGIAMTQWASKCSKNSTWLHAPSSSVSDASWHSESAYCASSPGQGGVRPRRDQIRHLVGETEHRQWSEPRDSESRAPTTGPGRRSSPWATGAAQGRAAGGLQVACSAAPRPCLSLTPGSSVNNPTSPVEAKL